MWSRCLAVSDGIRFDKTRFKLAHVCRLFSLYFENVVRVLVYFLMFYAGAVANTSMFLYYRAPLLEGLVFILRALFLFHHD